MARLALTRRTMGGTKNPAVVAFAAGDAVLLADGAEFDLMGGEILVVHNPTVGAITATLLGAPDTQGRDVDSAQVVAANDGMAVFGPVAQDGWQQTGGKGHLDVTVDGLLVTLLAPA